MNSFSLGMTVRRLGRFKRMTVIDVADDRVTCGWISRGRFYKRTFHADILKQLAPYNDQWPMM